MGHQQRRKQKHIQYTGQVAICLLNQQPRPSAETETKTHRSLSHCPHQQAWSSVNTQTEIYPVSQIHLHLCSLNNPHARWSSTWVINRRNKNIFNILDRSPSPCLTNNHNHQRRRKQKPIGLYLIAPLTTMIISQYSNRNLSSIPNTSSFFAINNPHVCNPMCVGHQQTKQKHIQYIG